MSRGNEEALVTLATITGCLVGLKEKNCFSVVARKREVEEALNLSVKVGRIWFSKFEDNSTNTHRMVEKISNWREWMGEKQEELSCGAIASACHRLCSDLEEKLRNREKKKLVGELKKMLESIEWFATLDGIKYDCIEEGNLIVNKLQEEMGWEETNVVRPPEEN